MSTSTKSVFTATILCSLAVGLNAGPTAGHHGAHGPGPNPGGNEHQKAQQHRSQHGAPSGTDGAKAGDHHKKHQGANQQEEHQPAADGHVPPGERQGPRTELNQANHNTPPGPANGHVPQPGEATPVVNHRLEHQEARIANGIKSGELTGGEVFRLQREEAKIKAEAQTARADGKVTPQERQELNRDLNKASRDIAKEKHDSERRLPTTPPPLPPALPPTK